MHRIRYQPVLQPLLLPPHMQLPHHIRMLRANSNSNNRNPYKHNRQRRQQLPHLIHIIHKVTVCQMLICQVFRVQTGAQCMAWECMSKLISIFFLFSVFVLFCFTLFFIKNSLFPTKLTNEENNSTDTHLKLVNCTSHTFCGRVCVYVFASNKMAYAF